MSGGELDSSPPEFNPLLYPPCSCPRHSYMQQPRQEPEPGPEPGEDSPSLLELRARITEENRLRRWLRGSS